VNSDFVGVPPLGGKDLLKQELQRVWKQYVGVPPLGGKEPAKAGTPTGMEAVCWSTAFRRKGTC